MRAAIHVWLHLPNQDGRKDYWAEMTSARTTRMIRIAGKDLFSDPKLRAAWFTIFPNPLICSERERNFCVWKTCRSSRTQKKKENRYRRIVRTICCRIINSKKETEAKARARADYSWADEDYGNLFGRPFKKTNDGRRADKKEATRSLLFSRRRQRRLGSKRTNAWTAQWKRCCCCGGETSADWIENVCRDQLSGLRLGSTRERKGRFVRDESKDFSSSFFTVII